MGLISSWNRKKRWSARWLSRTKSCSGSAATGSAKAVLLSLLGLLHQKPRRRARLSSVAPVGWPNVPENSGCTLAFVPEAELSGLLARRKELTPSLLHLGSTVWDAMCGGDPREVAALAAQDSGPEPSLAPRGTPHPSLRASVRYQWTGVQRRTRLGRSQ